MTPNGIETAEGLREFDIVVWATGFDFGTGALARMGIRGRNGLALTDYWADGPKTFLGVQTAGFPNFFFPGGPHAAAGNNPRYNGDQVDFITDTLIYVRDHGYDTIEVDPAAEEQWTNMIDAGAKVLAVRREQLLLRHERPGQARALSHQLARPAQAVLGDRRQVRARLQAFKLSDGVIDRRRFRLSRRGERAADRAGQAQRRRGEQEAAPVVLANQAASSCRYHISPSGTPSLNRQRWWIGNSECRPSYALPADHSFDRVVVGDERGDLRLGDPLEE